MYLPYYSQHSAIYQSKFSKLQSFPFLDFPRVRSRCYLFIPVDFYKFAGIPIAFRCLLVLRIALLVGIARTRSLRLE